MPNFRLFTTFERSKLNIDCIKKFGVNFDIDTGIDPEDVISTGGLYTWVKNNANPITISSTSALDTTSGTGVQRIRMKGFDSDWNLQQEDINLNGTTEISSVNNYHRLFRIESLRSGSTDINQGDIVAKHDGTTEIA